jgi:hypothetical protein
VLTFRHNLTQCIQVFLETGSVDRKKGSGRPTKRTVEAIATRQDKTNYGRSPTNFFLSVYSYNKFNCQPALVSILKKDIHLYPYRLQAVHQLLETDYPVRVEYCHWFLNTMDENLLNGVSSLTNLGSTWTVIPTHKTDNGGIQKNLISLERFHCAPKRWECGRLFHDAGLFGQFF